MWFRRNPTNPTYRRKTVRDETLVLGDPSLVTYLIKSTFERCEITITCPARGLIIDRCVFRDCAIHAKKPQRDHQFFTSTFERCRFTGRFSGCEFGFRIDLYGKTKGTIRDCDLREAELDFVTFSNCDLASLALPRWPHFMLVDPGTTAGHLPNPRNCPELEALKAVASRHTPITKGSMRYAPAFAKKSLYSLDELRELLSGVEGVLI